MRVVWYFMSFFLKYLIQHKAKTLQMSEHMSGHVINLTECVTNVLNVKSEEQKVQTTC